MVSVSANERDLVFHSIYCAQKGCVKKKQQNINGKGTTVD